MATSSSQSTATMPATSSANDCHLSPLDSDPQTPIQRRAPTMPPTPPTLQRRAPKPQFSDPLNLGSFSEHLPVATAAGVTALALPTPVSSSPAILGIHISTSIKFQAVERKNRLRDAAAQQLQWDEDSTSQPGDPAQTDHGFQQSAPPTDETLAVVASGPAATAKAVATTSEGTLGASDGCSLQTPSKPSDPPALVDVVEQQLANSIQQIEKMVSRNLKRVDPKAARPSKTQALQRRTLMSMR